LIYLINFSYFLKTYNQQIGLQKNFLTKQNWLLASEIEKTGSQFENDLNEILFSQNITRFFSDPVIKATLENRLEIFYSRYNTLVKNILYYNDKKEVFSLFYDKKNKFITDVYTAHDQRPMVGRSITDFQNNEYLYYLPVFKSGEISGNLVVTLDYLAYISSVSEKAHLTGIQWQWMIDKNGKVLFNNLQNNHAFQVVGLNRIQEDISSDTPGVISHEIIMDGGKADIISSYYPVRLLNRDFGVIFSLKTDSLLKSLKTNSIIIVVLTTLLLAMIILVYEIFLRDKKRQWHQVNNLYNELIQIWDTLPLSIIILKENQKIYRMNQTARDLFREEGLTEGEKLGEWFNNLTNSGEADIHSTSEEIELLFYQTSIKEHVLIKDEIQLNKLNNQKEKLFVEVFYDLTPYEKVRKQETLALKTKTEFLTKMSNEIRNPLNDILKLSDNLESKSITVVQRENLSGIKKTAGLLLSMVDDMRMFSELEAGDVFLEEIPFKLDKELELCMKPLRPKAKKRDLKLNLIIAGDVTNNLIGDPFKIRLIISYLVEFAIKFTEKGKIDIRVESVENKTGKIVLRFKIEDTGKGIPKDKLNMFFKSDKHAEITPLQQFKSPELGMALVKQMVKMLRGEISVDSPSGLSTHSSQPGTVFIFTAELFSNERLKKQISIEKITSFSHIKTLIIKDNEANGQNIQDILKNFGISCKVNFNQNKTANLIASNSQSEKDRYQLLIFMDSESFNAFSLAETLYKKGLWKNFLILIISSNDKKGNRVKSRKLGIDYYLIEPCDGSEIFEILIENFTHIQLTRQQVPKMEKLREEINILLAEDNQINQKVIRVLFKNLGYELDIVENGNEVLDQIKQRDYDIVFMDVMMPEMDGYEATSALRDQGYTRPVVAITADVSDEARNKAKNTGINDFIPKPVKIDEIKRVLIRFFLEAI